MSWHRCEIREKRNKALLQMCSAWRHGTAQHKTQPSLFSYGAAPRLVPTTGPHSWQLCQRELSRRGAAGELWGNLQTCQAFQQREGRFVYLLAHELQQKIKIQQHNGVWMEKRRSEREHIGNTVMSLYEGGSLEVREVHCLRP